MELLFHGAARQVTGSLYHLTTAFGYQIVIDCGLDYEKNSPRNINAQFPFNPENIDIVILTHAHIDHSGNLPTLVSQGYEGPIICTEPTADLAEILLMDSAKIELNRAKRGRNNKVKHKRLYSYKNVYDTNSSLLTIPFRQAFELHPDIKLTLIPAGHIVGAASVVLEITENNKTQTITFSGDLGNNNVPLIVDPVIPKTDYLIMEGTYGGRYKKDKISPEKILEKHIRKTCIDQKGKLIIPAFSVGRTQAILYSINNLYRKTDIPRIQVFSDSPLGQSSGKIHQKHLKYLNKNAQEFHKKHNTLFDFKDLYMIEDEGDKEFMQSYANSSILVSSAGMMEGGRIKDHIARNIMDKKSTILIAGYCIPGTLGHTIQNASSVKIHHKNYEVFAEIANTDVLSAHPDHNGLVEYANATNKNKKLKKLFLCHGELESLSSLEQTLSSSIDSICIPEKGAIYKL